MRRPPSSSLVPYTTLFRSAVAAAVGADAAAEQGVGARGDQAGDLVGGAFAGQDLGGDLRQAGGLARAAGRSEEHTSELQSRENLVCRPLLEKKNKMLYEMH